MDLGRPFRTLALFPFALRSWWGSEALRTRGNGSTVWRGGAAFRFAGGGPNLFRRPRPRHGPNALGVGDPLEDGFFRIADEFGLRVLGLPAGLRGFTVALTAAAVEEPYPVADDFGHGAA